MIEAKVRLSPKVERDFQKLVEVDYHGDEVEALERAIELLTRNRARIAALQTLHTPRLRLIVPLYVMVESTDTVVVCHSDLEVFGYGDTESEAVMDFCECVVETYYELKTHRHVLGPHLQQAWEFLSRVVLEVEPNADYEA